MPKGKQNGMYGRIGILNPNWKGGVSPLRQTLYCRSVWKEKIKEIFKRDNWTCQNCGYKNSTDKKLVVHHIKTWAEYPKLRFENSNLITLCEECHWKRHSKDGTAKRFVSKRKPRKKTMIKCIVCGKERQEKPNRIKKGFGKFCSKKCMGEYRKIQYLGKNNPFYGKKHSIKTKGIIKNVQILRHQQNKK